MQSKVFSCVVVLAAVLLPSILSPAADGEQSADEQELTRIENDWGQSYINRDPSFAERITTDDFTFVGADGKLVEKSSYLNSIKANTVFKQFKIDDLTIRIYGETAVVIGAATIMSKAGKSEVIGRYAFTDVFVKQSGGWKAVSGQVTPIAKSQP